MQASDCVLIASNLDGQGSGHNLLQHREAEDVMRQTKNNIIRPHVRN
jgi:hypothetical protein